MSDDGFRLPTAESKCALETATHLLNWCSIEANHPCIENYHNTSMIFLLITSNPKMSKFEIEKIWIQFHNYITSSEFLIEILEKFV